MLVARSALFIAAFAVAGPAGAELLAHKDLSLATALTIATTASEACKGQGYRVSVAVVGRNNEVIVQLRGDEASPHTYENSFRKAYTARTFRQPSGEIANRYKQDAAYFAVHLSNIIPAGRAADQDRRGDDWRGRGVRGAWRRQGRGLRQGRHRQGCRPAEVSVSGPHHGPAAC